MPQVPENPSEALEMLERMLSTPADPSRAQPYPPSLPLEIALNSIPLAEILEAYKLTPEQMKAIIQRPDFQRDLEKYRLELQQDGYSFRMKARAQAEEYLNTAWKMVHSPDVPSNVRADLIKQTVRWGALEAPPPVAGASGQGPMLSTELIENLRELPDSELEIRVAQILVRRGGSERPLTGELIEGALIEGEKDVE